MAEFKDRLKEISNGYGSQRSFSRLLGVSDTAVGRWLKGGDVTLSNLKVISQSCGLELEWLATGEGPKFSGANAFGEFTLVPRYGVQASAGHGQLVDEEAKLEDVPFKSHWLHSRNLQPNQLALVEVTGDSMEPTLENRDLILFDMGDKRLKDSMLYVLNLNGVLMVKRILTMVDGTIIVRSDNEAYEDQKIVSEKINDLRILGRVVWFSREL